MSARNREINEVKTDGSYTRPPTLDRRSSLYGRVSLGYGWARLVHGRIDDVLKQQTWRQSSRTIPRSRIRHPALRSVFQPKCRWGQLFVACLGSCQGHGSTVLATSPGCMAFTLAVSWALVLDWRSCATSQTRLQ